MDNSCGQVLMDEYISKRCEEILLKDVQYNKINSNILSMESNFKKTLSREQIKEYNYIEELAMHSVIHAAVCAYKACLKDAQEALK